MSDETTILYRPVGQKELDLIREGGFVGFPPRLFWQPIFYPVLNEEYAAGIARNWNTKDEASGYVGYAILDGYFPSTDGRTLGDHYMMIPYVGVNRSIVTTGVGKAQKTSASSTVDPGILLSLATDGRDLVHIFNVRPDLLFDLENDSSLASVNLQYIPYVTVFPLNSFTTVKNPLLDFAFKIILDARADIGTYADRGSVAVASMNVDYRRFGGQGGISIISEDDAIPIAFTSTYTGLYGASGGVDVGDFVNTLTFYLDPNKNVGVSASYANGVREDTGKRENNWLIGLSFHY